MEIRWKARIWLAVLVVTTFVVVQIFRFVPSFWAPKVAGALFVSIGIAIVYPGLKSALWRKTLIFWMGLIHLFITAGPLLVIHITGFAQELYMFPSSGQVQFFTLGQILHRAAEWIYTLLIIGALIDSFRFGGRKHKRLKA